MQFTIVLNDKCNLSCEYCCVLDSLNQGNELPIEEIYKFFEWQLPLYSSEETHIVEFFGGEPTLGWDKLKDIIEFLDTKFTEYSFHYRIYTNCIFSNDVKKDLETWKRFDEIICSIDGEFEDNLLRTDSLKLYNKSIQNYKDLLELGNTGIAFVLHPESDYKRVYNYFKDMGTQYFHFEIATLWKDNKDNGITLDFLLEVFEFIYNNVLTSNIDLGSLELFSIPKELLSSENYFNHSKNLSCMDTMRSLSSKGNIYFCRDLAVSEDHLKKEEDKSSDLIFRQNSPRLFNIKDIQLDKDSNEFSSIARQYDEMTPCPVKSFEYIHFVGETPEWIENKSFQDIVVKPLFDVMNLTFYKHAHNKMNDREFLEFYQDRVDTYGKILTKYREISKN